MSHFLQLASSGLHQELGSVNLSCARQKKYHPSARRPSRTKVLFVMHRECLPESDGGSNARYDAADVIDASSAGVSPIDLFLT